MSKKKIPSPSSPGKTGPALRRLSGQDDLEALFTGKNQARTNFASLVQECLADRDLVAILAEKEADPDFPPYVRPRKSSALPQPQEQLDLHGCTAAEAEMKTENFLAAAQRQRLRTVLIITGKGLHSPQGSVLKDVIETRLRLWKNEKKILDYSWEKKQREESGALVVHLP